MIASSRILTRHAFFATPSWTCCTELKREFSLYISVKTRPVERNYFTRKTRLNLIWGLLCIVPSYIHIPVQSRRKLIKTKAFPEELDHICHKKWNGLKEQWRTKSMVWHRGTKDSQSKLKSHFVSIHMYEYLYCFEMNVFAPSNPRMTPFAACETLDGEKPSSVV